MYLLIALLGSLIVYIHLRNINNRDNIIFYILDLNMDEFNELTRRLMSSKPRGGKERAIKLYIQTDKPLTKIAMCKWIYNNYYKTI